LGVHPNRFDTDDDTDDDAGLYVPRDIDTQIIAALQSATVTVVVYGARLAGASRSLAHHARRLLPEHRVLRGTRTNPLVARWVPMDLGVAGPVPGLLWRTQNGGFPGGWLEFSSRTADLAPAFPQVMCVWVVPPVGFEPTLSEV
jgi:hypothetical protein